MNPSLSVHSYVQSKYPGLDESEEEVVAWLYEHSEGDDAGALPFWRSIVLDAHLAGHLACDDARLAIDTDLLAASFYHDKRKAPAARSLAQLLDDLKQTGDLVPLDVFQRVYATESWWTRIFKPFALLRRGSTPPTRPSVHVVMRSVQAVAAAVLQQYWSEQHKGALSQVLTLAEFRQTYAQCHPTAAMTDQDIWLLLKFMHRECGVAIDPNVQGYGHVYTMIKLPAHPHAFNHLTHQHPLSHPNCSAASTSVGATNTSNSRAKHAKHTPVAITQHDRAIIGLKTTCDALHRQVKELQTKIDAFIQTSLDHVVKKQKLQALYALKRKKQLEKILDRRLSSLETIETLLLKIDTSHNDVQIMRAFNVGVAALRQILEVHDLRIDTVDKTMERVHDAFEDQQRVEDAITAGMHDWEEPPLHDDNDNRLRTWPPTWGALDTLIHTNEKRPRFQMEADDDDTDTSLSSPYPTPQSSQDIPEHTNSELARLHSILTHLHVPDHAPRAKYRRRTTENDPLLA
ncbi:Snf7-domain-containing protein [Gongronella butleri]|nr:Snf7-domain-containing protein [Gongronella butleri]